MSRRRFGRNQKRRLREEAARALEAAEMANGLARVASANRDRAESELSELARRVRNASPQLTALLPAKMRDWPQYESRFRMPPRPRFGTVRVSTQNPLESTYQTVEVSLHDLMVAVESLPKENETAVHFMVTPPNGDDRMGMHYRFSDHAFIVNDGFPPEVVRDVTQHCLRELQKAWRGKNARGA